MSPIREDEIYIFVGSNSLNGNSPFQKSYSVKKVFPHKGFRIGTYKNDIGLIQLNKRIEFNDRVKPIRLPVEKDLYKSNYTATLTGWGKFEVYKYLRNISGNETDLCFLGWRRNS